MKKIVTMMLAFTFMLILSSSLLAQSVGDYRTRASGNWSVAQSWQRYNGSTWANVATPPSGSETITILSTDSIFVNVPVAITGTLVNQGIVEPDVNLTIANGGIYQHDRDGGRVPLATWAEGSTMLITGVTTTAPNDRDQDYYNLTFNTPGLLSNLNMNLNGNTVGGDVRVITTGTTNRWYLTTALATDTAIVTIMGDVIMEAGQFSVQGTSNAQTVFEVHHYGDIVVTGGNFSIARGSQAGGKTTWYLHEGNFSMSNATTQNSNATPGGAKFVFAKAGTQTLTLGTGNTLTALPIEVSSGTTLDMGAGVLAGSGTFTVNEGATLLTALPGGVAEILSAVTGAVT
ncbi:T9SS C-terminal target domain-containing protein, partial [candidate division KSB1 bacterium]|nr:T9SS C-terminal target domain-containing protein [candidate division KSB1 bacterium]